MAKLKTRIAEHKKAEVSFDQNFKVASHFHHFRHNMSFENVKVVGFEANYHEQPYSYILFFRSHRPVVHLYLQLKMDVIVIGNLKLRVSSTK